MEKGSGPSPEEIKSVQFQLGQVEHLLLTLHESLAAIRFGLACAGYPISIDECLKHPIFVSEIERRAKAAIDDRQGARERALINEIERLQEAEKRAIEMQMLPRDPTWVRIRG